MAFWGIEVKPGKPHTHIHDIARGKLRITQATLGNGTSTKRNIVQCNVGSRSPILLCALLPDKVESCSLELEFEEEEEVVFSVVGPRSVHLSGFYPGPEGFGDGDDDSESYGEDIAESESDESESYDSEDGYEDDFIDDDDMEMFPPMARPNSGVVIEEIVDDEKPAKGIDNNRIMKKKRQTNNSDNADVGSERQIVLKQDQSPLLESEDEDGFPISLSHGNGGNAKATEGDEANQGSNNAAPAKGSQSETKRPSSKTSTEVDIENSGKSKKKKKGQLNLEKSREANDSRRDDIKKQSLQQVEADEHAVNEAEESGKLKKRKGEAFETLGKLSAKKTKDDTSGDQNESNSKETNSVSMEQNLPAGEKQDATGSQVAAAGVHSGVTLHSSGKKSKKNKKKRTKGEVPQDGEEMDAETLDKDGIDRCQNEGDGNLNGSESNQKKKKTKSNLNDLSTKAEGAKELMKEKGLGEKVRPQQTRTFPNGLAIEELSMGKPDGKRASAGKKVFVHYIGKLKNGKIFDSNIGQRPFEFRLGVGRVIKGWDIGIDGMRIGDKRKLTIPPAMGYGNDRAGKIPPNSWLVFDVELVDVL